MLPKGEKAAIEIDTIPPFPAQILAIKDAYIQQHAKDAWTTAWQLKIVLRLWMYFRMSHELAITIDDASQRKISELFPTLQNIKMVLDAYVSVSLNESRSKPGHSDFPAGHWANLHRAFTALIGSRAKTLCNIGGHKSIFSLATDETLQRFSNVTQGVFELDSMVPKIKFAKGGLKEATILTQCMDSLISLLATAPATALALPNSSGSGSQNKHSLDFTSVIWEGKQFNFHRGQAKCIRLLWEAWENGTPVLSEKEIGIAIEAENNNFQLAKVFRKKKRMGGYENHPAWGTMIERAGKGTFRLASKKTQKP